MSNKRPVLKLKYSNFEKITEIVALFSIAFMICFTILSWPSIPDRIATHFDILGNPDSYGGKGGLYILPIVGIFLYLLLTLISRYPHSFNYSVNITEENAPFQYRNARALMICEKAEIALMFTYLQRKFISVSLGRTKSLGIWFLPVFLIAIFGTLYYFIKKSLKDR